VTGAGMWSEPIFLMNYQLSDEGDVWIYRRSKPSISRLDTEVIHVFALQNTRRMPRGLTPRRFTHFLCEDFASRFHIHHW